ncbi:RIP metalloprotease RseP [Microbulbifer thermotolerans]|uniref:Zinc metalloprotease n=1 Tax=Microbulbifer thermotolerans TaxID=252514 RepID=A0AB35HVK0_MICTH|nr:RIP metalloprotease RseP [Microbulbifer thermotolerans]MCX2793687.1 RIP metalloprotease RseP [Microbulbifer thermotolerans]MCX2800871.1 RIP metalloprotease RseP [Microbulbifer thermotolerans]MCX2830274.1 RIP metalloprotease RseP [Microbulbifer thermotolerans]MCX2834761.1 RIP metalloprotease RseP [Microbulbifer thermotolerans]MCX2841124.1 RIP metalloprotease RseP [Microbulbifer thermotolerans]
MDFIQTVIWALVALGVLVSFHEYGHFLVARLCGVKVLRFSVGFGRRLVSRYDRHGTEFTLSAIPLGGYVKMLDEREGPVREDELHMAFNRKSVWARMAIVAAGPFANFLLAIVFFWVVFMGGTAGPVPIVQSVEAGSVAARAGLEPGQEIIAVDGESTPTWQALNWQLANRLGDSGTIEFSVRYPDSELEYHMEADIDRWMSGKEVPDPVKEVGLELWTPPITMVLSQVTADSPAESAGLRAGDRIVLTDGRTFDDWGSWSAYVRARPGEEILVEVERDGTSLEIPVVPREVTLESGESVGQIGVLPVAESWPEDKVRTYHYGVGGAFAKGLQETWEKTLFTLNSLKKLLLGQLSTKNLSGPITIAKVAGSSAEAGWQSFLSLLALLSISLGVLNLLPIPVLDGGHLLYYGIEAIKGSPVSERVQMIGLQVGMAVVLGIMGLALYNDILRL